MVSPTLGESKFKYTSGGSCGRACNVPPIDWDIYLRCKNISYRARYRPLAKSERKAQGRKGHTKTAEEHGANGDCIGARDVVGLLRLAQCMETAKVFCNYEDCKRKRVGEDFSAFVHTKTAKHFGNY